MHTGGFLSKGFFGFKIIEYCILFSGSIGHIWMSGFFLWRFCLGFYCYWHWRYDTKSSKLVELIRATKIRDNSVGSYTQLSFSGWVKNKTFYDSVTGYMSDISRQLLPFTKIPRALLVVAFSTIKKRQRVFSGKELFQVETIQNNGMGFWNKSLKGEGF